jgi:hypothetical protein
MQSSSLEAGTVYSRGPIILGVKCVAVIIGAMVLSALTVESAAAQDLAATCRRVWGLRADGSNLRAIPASFPAAPREAQRCTARESTKTVYFIWDAPFDRILAYWEMTLQRQGYRTQRVGGRTADRGFLRFSGPDQGKISLSPRGGGFVVVLGPS